MPLKMKKWTRPVGVIRLRCRRYISFQDPVTKRRYRRCVKFVAAPLDVWEVSIFPEYLFQWKNKVVLHKRKLRR